MLGRRSFLFLSGWFVADLALAKDNAPPSAIVSPPVPTNANEMPAVALRIDGWETPADFERDTRSRVWIGINNSWRAAWR